MIAAAALLPVLLFLAVLFLMDSFKLVPLRTIGAALAAGAGAAGIVLWLHGAVLPLDRVDPHIVARYVAPLTEEAAKGALIVLLVAGGRVGFLVDAAVNGFAIGAGFALVENITYLYGLPDASVSLWVARGFGTAMLHGSTSAILAMIAQARHERLRGRPIAVFGPAFAAAAAIHSAFNHLLVPPAIQTVIMLVVLPILLVLVFDRSERATREWIGAGLDLDLEVLQLVASEHFALTRFGEYLRALRSRFEGALVADMYCLLRLELELGVQAKALVMARGAGLELPADEDLDAALAERACLQRSIGRAGLLALKPLAITSHRDAWHRRLLRR